jgi:hypothetical protein
MENELSVEPEADGSVVRELDDPHLGRTVVAVTGLSRTFERRRP